MSDSRRRFLTGVGAAALAPPLAAAMDPVPRTGPPRMRLSLAGYSYRKYLTDYRRGKPGPPGSMTLEDFVDLCAKLELDGTEPTMYYVPLPVRDDYLRRLRKRAFLQGLSISGTAIGNTFAPPPRPPLGEGGAQVKAWVDHAVALGAPTIRIFAGDVQKGSTEEQARRSTIDAIQRCCAYAGERGVILALENHGGIVTRADQLLSIVKEVKSEWFGVNWDSGNFRSDDAYGELEQLAPYAVTSQIKTKVGGKPADLARVVGILKKANYRGWLALEYEDEEDPKTAVPRILEELRGLVRS